MWTISISPVRLVVLAALVAVGPASHATSPSTSSPPGPEVLLSVPMSFSAAGGVTLPVPLVEARVGGETTRLIVDSGSSHHVLTPEFAQRIEASVVEDDGTGRLHGGDTVSVGTVADTVELDLADRTWRLRQLRVVEVSAPLSKLGIGGFLSPQKLVYDGGTVVLCMSCPRLLVLEGGAPEAMRWARERGERPTELEIELGELGRFFTTASAGGRGPSRALLDTGASGTEARASYLGTWTTGEDCADAGAEGDECAGAGERRKTVRFAGRRFDSLAVGSGTGTAADLVLGMDVLRRCTLALARSPRPAAWVACGAGG